MSAKCVCKCGHEMQTYGFVRKFCRHADIVLYNMYIYKVKLGIVVYIFTFGYFLRKYYEMLTMAVFNIYYYI